jgi:hypothetical protein
VTDPSAWELISSTGNGHVVVPDVGLKATKRELTVVRSDGQHIHSWPWNEVESLRVGAALKRPDGVHRRVEVVADGDIHVFVCPTAELEELMSSLEHHAPWLYAMIGRRAHGSGHMPVRLRSFASKQAFAVRNWRRVSMRERLAPISIIAAALLVCAGVLTGAATAGGASPTANRSATSSNDSGYVMKRMKQEHSRSPHLAPATVAPTPAPPTLANSPALKPHEVFGFAPYWTLPSSSSFEVNDLSTIAYFSLDVNGDGSISESGPGWEGYQSQDLSDLITRAHQADSRVVLTITCFGQSTLDSLTSDPNAPRTLSSALVSLLEAKSLDGLNIDFEGEGSGDQSGLSNLVSQVSTSLRAVDPHWQITMDTYASSAGDPAGFYDVPALAQSVDAFFVMAYDMDDSSTPSPTAALTGGPGFSDTTTVQQYASAVAPSKVILGVPYYGYEWPTTGPALGDPATGSPVAVTYAQIAAGGYPTYWDPTTQTPWTSFKVGNQWYQAWFDDPTSLALKAQLANSYNLAGVGVWALGMDGNDPAMMAALLGDAPATKDYQPGPTAQLQSPTSTSTSSSTSSTTSNPSGSNSSGVSSTNNSAQVGSNHTSSSTSTSSPSTTTTSSPTTSTTTSTTAPPTGNTGNTSSSSPSSSPSTPTYTFSGKWNQNTETMSLVNPSTITVGNSAGTLTGFTTNDPAFSCLIGGPALSVHQVKGSTTLYIVSATTPTDCVNGTWEFDPPASTAATGTSDPTQATSSTSSTASSTSNTSRDADPPATTPASSTSTSSTSTSGASASGTDTTTTG